MKAGKVHNLRQMHTPPASGEVSSETGSYKANIKRISSIAVSCGTSQADECDTKLCVYEKDRVACPGRNGQRAGEQCVLQPLVHTLRVHMC